MNVAKLVAADGHFHNVTKSVRQRQRNSIQTHTYVVFIHPYVCVHERSCYFCVHQVELLLLSDVSRNSISNLNSKTCHRHFRHFWEVLMVHI